jgi:hypothetical protein
LGSGDNDLLGESRSGLVGGEEAFVALSDRSSSDRWEEPVEPVDLDVLGKMSGAL